jgi:O-antigen/teichoic acid export membrane protein
VGLLLVVAAVLLIASGGEEQELVHFYAVSVFASFLAATLAAARLSAADRHWAPFALNCLGAALVTLVLGINLTRLESAIALGASGLIALALWLRWVRRGRPDHHLATRR